MTQTAAISDQQLICNQRFNDRLAPSINAMINDALIAEHQRAPLALHSDALERVLNFFRRPPLFGLYSAKPCREFQLIRLPIALGDPPKPFDDSVYYHKDEAMHAIFLQHIAALQARLA